MATEGEGASGTGGTRSVGETASSSIRPPASFTPGSLDRAEKQAARVADRWAPESAAAQRAPALRSLSFVDRLLAPARPFLAGPGAPAAPGELPAVGGERAARAASPEMGAGGSAWWLFPTPWYLDALASIQGEVVRARPTPAWKRQAAHDADVAMGRVPVPPVEPARPVGPSKPIVAGDVARAPIAQTVPGPTAAPRAADAPKPLAATAPAMPQVLPPPAAMAPAAPGPSVAPAEPAPGAPARVAPAVAPTAPVAPRAPEVPAAPIAAAEPVAPRVDASAPIAAPEDFVPAIAEALVPPPVAAPPVPAPAAAPAVSAPAVSAPARAPFAAAAPMPMAVPVALAALRAWTPLVPAPAAQAAEQLLGRYAQPAREPRRAPDTSSLIRALVAPDEGEPVATAQPRARAATPPARPAEAPAPAVAARELPTAAEPPAGPPTPAPSVAAPAAAAVEAAPLAELPPAAGPRVLLPAGLSGLSAGLGAQSLVHSAIERAALPTSSAPAPRPIAVPGPLAHVAWADAWLHRVAGTETTPAGPEAPTTAASAARALLAQAPSQVFLAPPELPTVARPGVPAPAPLASSAAARAAVPGMPVVAPSAEPVAAARPQAPAQVVARPPAPSMPVVEPPAAPTAGAPPAPTVARARAAERVAPTEAPAAAAPGAVPPSAAPIFSAQAAAPIPAPALDAGLALVGAPSIGLASGLGAAPTIAAPAAAPGALPAPAATLAGVDVARAPLSHVAWADHWLSRFVGAPLPSAEQAAAAARPVGAVGLAAPGAEPVYVSPQPDQAGAPPAGRPGVAPSARPGAPAGRAAEMPVVSPETPAQPLAAARPAPAPTRIAAPTAAPAPAEAPSAPEAVAARAAAPAEPTGLDVGLPPTGWAAWAPPPAVAGAPLPSFAPGLPAALMASPVAAQLAGVLGVAPWILSGTGTLIERLRGPAAAAAGERGRAPSAQAAPTLVYPSLAGEPATTATEGPAARPAGRPVPAAAARAGVPAAAPTPPTAAAAAEAPAPVAPSMRPGAIGSRAELFAAVERLRATDLALDYVSPELVEAAQMYGFGAADATRAARFAEAGVPVLSALTAGANMALLQLEGSRGAAPTAVPGQAPAARAAARAPMFRAQDLVPLVPDAHPRGAFAVSKVARDTFARQRPEAAWPTVMPTELAALDVMAATAVAGHAGGTDRLASARAGFEADYVSMASFGAGPTPATGVPPMVPAARALARAAGHPRERPGFNVDMPSAQYVSVGATEIPVHEVASALRSLVAPVVPTSVSGGFVSRAPIAGGPLPSIAPPPAPEPIRAASDARAQAPLGSPDFPLPDWFEAAAKKLLAGDRAEDKFGLPELTLIQSVSSQPAQRIAAKEVGETAPAAPPVPGASAKDSKKEDIEQIARDVYDEIRRMLDAALLRSGELCP